MSERIVRKVDRFGRISIPATLRGAYGIDIGDDLAVIPGEQGLYIKKISKRAKCLVTGKESDDIKVYGEGVFLSEEGKTKLQEMFKNEAYKPKIGFLGNSSQACEENSQKEKSPLDGNSL